MHIFVKQLLPLDMRLAFCFYGDQSSNKLIMSDLNSILVIFKDRDKFRDSRKPVNLLFTITAESSCAHWLIFIVNKRTDT